MFIYTENDIEYHRNTQNINTQHENTFIFHFLKIFENPYFSKIISSNNSAFYAELIALFLFYVEGTI